MWYKRHVFRFLTTSFLFILFRPRRETRAVFYPSRVHIFCVMTYRPLREASDGVINGAAFRQCYTVCCTCGPLKVYGQDTKSRTRCHFSQEAERKKPDFIRLFLFWMKLPEGSEKVRHYFIGIAFLNFNALRVMIYIPNCYRFLVKWYERLPFYPTKEKNINHGNPPPSNFGL